MDEKRLREIAKREDLNNEQEEILVGLFKKRFPDEQFESYVGEWAERIKNNKAWLYGDNNTRKVLTTLGVTE